YPDRDNDTKVWDATTGQEIRSLKGPVGKIVFSPDGKRLVGTSEDRTVKMWDAQTGDEMLYLKGAAANDGGSTVVCVAFSHDGERLAAGGPNGTVLIYDATPLPEKP